MRELIDIGLRHTPASGANPTEVPQLHIMRVSEPALAVHALQEPALCYVVQGAKNVTVGSKTYGYAAGEYLVTTIELPVVGTVTRASVRSPYLCYVITIEPQVVHDVLGKGAIEVPTSAHPAIYVGQGEPPLADVVLRLARCLDRPSDRAVLLPGIVCEIAYRLLQGPFGGMVRDLAVVDSHTQRISRAIAHIRTRFSEPLRVMELAQLAGMSPSAFHHHFRRVTTYSPVQYQKHLRLQEARRLLLCEGAGSAEVAFRVGYQSASQFSREYARLFGQPPKRDSANL